MGKSLYFLKKKKNRNELNNNLEALLLMVP